MSEFRIFQISDIHITLKKGRTIDNIDVIDHFDAVLSKAKEVAPDLLVLSGDLCFTHNDEKVYNFVRERLVASGLPFRVMAGNHDKSGPLSKAFSYADKGKEGLYYVEDHDPYRLIFLDSSKHKVIDEQLRLLAQDIQSDLKPVIFIHHPPAEAGVPFMDKKYPLLNRKELQDVLSHYKGRIPVFCGHYHNEADFPVGNLDVHLTPATYFQISRESHSFKLASSHPGWREIILGDSVESRVYYL